MMSIVEMSKVEIFQNLIFYSSDTFLVVTHNVSEVDPSCISSGNFDSKKCQNLIFPLIWAVVKDGRLMP